MKNDDIRKKLFHELKTVKSIMLTPKHVKVMKFLNTKGAATSAQVAEEFKTTPQLACMTLKKLHSMSYLDRVTEVRACGGNQFIYKSRF